MERVTASIVPGRTGKRGQELDLQDAQDCIYEAWETPDPKEAYARFNDDVDTPYREGWLGSGA